ncbi:hypothetical protein AB0L13_45900 [Saccharopolyspora shandongensis]
MRVLFPHLAELRIEGVHAAGSVVRIEAGTTGEQVTHPYRTPRAPK